MKKTVCVALALFFLLGLAGMSFAIGIPVVGSNGPVITTGTTDSLVPVIPPGPPPKK